MDFKSCFSKNNICHFLSRSLCYGKWESSKVASILSMLRDIVQLSNEELEQIIDKIGTVLKKLDPDEVPPVVYQILLLTNEHGLIIGRVIGYLSSYFNQTIIQEIDSEDLIGSTSKITLSSIRRSESIVMVHINSKASGHPIIKEVIKMLKSGLNVPDLIFNPFTLQVST